MYNLLLSPIDEFDCLKYMYTETGMYYTIGCINIHPPSPLRRVRRVVGLTLTRQIWKVKIK